MLVKARKRMVGNPEGVHEVLSKVVGTEGEVDRMKEQLKRHNGIHNPTDDNEGRRQEFVEAVF